MVFVPDRSAEGVARIDSDAGGSGDFAAVIGGAFNTERPLRELGVGGIESRIRYRTQRAIGNGAGFVAEWCWCNPIGGTIHPNDEPGEAWPRLCDALWRLIVDRVGLLMPEAVEAGETDAPTIGTDPNTPDAARLLHWLAWSGRVDGLRANVGWRLSFRPTDDSQLVEFPTLATTFTQVSPFNTGRPERPAPVANKPWLQLEGWWWSTIEPAGAALVAAIDWLRTAGAAEGVQAGLAAAGAMAGGVIPDTSTLPVGPHARKGDTKAARRPNRTKADIARDNGNIAAHLTHHPDATRDEVANETGIAPAHVSASIAWKAHKARQKEARNANRARAAGGVGDPSVDRFGGDDDDD